MILELILSVLAVSAVYEYLYDLLPRIPMWVTLPLLTALAVGASFLPVTILGIIAVAAVAGFVHGLVRSKVERASVQHVTRPRRAGLPPLP